MFKFIKHFLLFILILSFGILGLAYYNGMRINNYQSFISTSISQFQQELKPYLNKENTNQELDTKKIEHKKKSVKPQKLKDSQTNHNTYKLQPLPKNPFAQLDRYVRNCPKSESKTIKRLASYLKKHTFTDLEKARSIYVWITDNIRYDDKAFNSKKYPNYTPENILKNKKAVCAGFSILYYELGIEMGLQIKKVNGYAKGYGYKVRSQFKQSNHAWNIINIDNQWKVFDATWGQGSASKINGKLKSKKKFSELWFNVDPYQAIFSHLPEKEENSFVKPHLSLKLYEKFPKLDLHFFNMGINAQEIYTKIYTYPHFKFPQSYPIESKIEIREAPIHKNLYSDKTYLFELFIPRGVQVALIDSKDEWIYFDRDNGVFKLKYNPKRKGKSTIVVKLESEDDSFKTLFIYNNKKRR